MPRPSDVGVGVAIILVEDGSFLLMRRQGSHGAGTWAFPGGWIDRTDESPLDVVKREAWEELGVTVYNAQLVGVTSEDHPDFRSVTLYYVVVSWVGFPRIWEPEKFMWHPMYEPLPEPTFPGLEDGVRQYLFPN